MQALSTVVYTIIHTFSDMGAIDFHSYWYSGQFLRQGTDPYSAYTRSLQPKTPIEFIDGSPTLYQPVGHPGLADVPANTAPMVLFLSLLSFFTWPTAKVLWMFCNFVFMILIPILMIRLLPGNQAIDLSLKVIIFLGFLSLFGVRNTAGNGQTGMLVILLMMIAWLLAPKNWFWAGTAFGMAISKYSLGLPFFILFLLLRQHRLLAVAMLFQVAGLVFLSLLTNQSPFIIVQSQIQIMLIHSGLSGIHLGNLFQDPTHSILASVSITIISGISVLTWFRKKNENIHSRDNNHIKSVYTWNLASVLVLWTLLIAYHRAYDTLIVAIVLVLLLYGLTQDKIWSISERQIKLISIASLVFCIILILPASGITVLGHLISPELISSWKIIHSMSITVSLVGMLVISVWLMIQIDHGQETNRQSLS
jgi:hypothetical protein